MKRVLQYILLCYIQVFAAEVPSWIYNPDESGMICDIGSASLKTSQSKKVAIVSAKANISKKIKIHIENETSSFKDDNDTRIFKTKSIQTSLNLIKNSFISDQYIDHANEIIYIRICAKIKLQ